MGKLGELAARHGLNVFEDACQAHGAERDAIKAGAAGDAAAFSFYPSKNLGAMGDAGALVLDDEGAAAKALALREHGQTSTYRSEYVGLTSRLDTCQALVLLRKLPLLEQWNSERASVAASYGDALAGVGDLRLPVPARGAKHVWHVYPIRTGDPEALGVFLRARGIATKRHYPEPPHSSAAFAPLGHKPGSFPVAEAIARETLSLPLFVGMTQEQLHAVVDGLVDFFAGG
jgi:dTDP-4-amino-4,6-dideoxygalactose transaminase